METGSLRLAAEASPIVGRAPPGPPAPAAGLSIHIVGSDLLPHNIEAADRGVYPQSALDGLPPATIRSYFSKISSPMVSPNGYQNEARDEGQDEGLSQTRSG